MNKSINKKVSLLVLIVLAICCAFAGITIARANAISDTDTNVVYAYSQEIEYEEGETFTYEVWFSPIEEFTSFSMDLVFPEFIQVVRVLPNYELGCDEDGRVGIMTGPNAGSYSYDVEDNLASVSLVATAPKYAELKLFTLELIALEDANQTGEVLASDFKFINANEDELSVEFNLGYIEIVSESLGRMGDMDGDNDVDLIDLVIVQRSITDLSGQYALNQTQRTLADINGDCVIDIIDCQLIREYIVGIIPSLDDYGKPVIKEHTVSIYYGYGDGGWNKYDDLIYEEGVSILESIQEFADANGIVVVESYYDANRQEQVLGADVLWNDIEIYLVLQQQELPTEYTFTVYYRNVTYGDEGCAGDYTAPANSYLIDYISRVASESGANVLGVFFDSDFENMIDSDYQITSNLSVWVLVESQQNESTSYVMSVYGSSQNGFVPAGTLDVHEGDNIYQIVINNYGYMMEILDGIFYDADMTMPVGEYDEVNGNLEIYLYISIMHGGGSPDENQEVYISIYVNRGNGEWTYDKQLCVTNGSYIYEAVYYSFNYMTTEVYGMYYDENMSNSVSEYDVANENLDVYVSINIFGGESKEDVLSVELVSEDGFAFMSYYVAIHNGDNILQTIRNRLGKENVTAFYMDGNNTPVGEDDVYSQNTCIQIKVDVKRITAVIFDQNYNYITKIYGYGFDGETLRISVEMSVAQYGYLVISMSESAEFNTELGFDVEVYNNAQVYVMVEIYNGGGEGMNAYCWIEAIENINGNLLPTGMGFGEPIATGVNLIDLASKLLSQIGNLYNVVGYYYDSSCTQVIPEDAVTVNGENSVYILLQLIDISGEYIVYSMSGDILDNLTVNSNGTATFGTINGEWNIISGMFFFNYGLYSQNIFMLQPSEEDNMAMLYSEFNAENLEVTEEYSAFVGTYIWHEEEMDEMGAGAYEIVLFGNGACQITAMGMIMRVPFSVVTDDIICIVLMGNAQHFNIDKENGVAEPNYFANYVGVFTLYGHSDFGEITLGSIEICIDGSSTITYTDGTKIKGTAVYNSGSILFYISEFHCYSIGLRWQETTIESCHLDEEFDGSDYVENPDYAHLVGSYDFLKYEWEDMYTLTLYANGVYTCVSYYGFMEMGRYEVYDNDIIALYYYDNYCESIIVYDQDLGAYVRYDGEIQLPDGKEDGNVVPEAWYTRIDDENVQMYFRQDGTVIINEYGNERESFYSYEGYIVNVEGIEYVLDIDNLTMQIKPIIDFPIGGGVVFQ